MPVSVNRSISSVTTDALPERMPLNRSPSGHERDALPPRPVGRREVRRDVVVGAEIARGRRPAAPASPTSGSSKVAAGERVLVVQDLAAHDLVDPVLVDLQLPQLLGELDRHCAPAMK